MVISSTSDAGGIVKGLREEQGLTRKELSEQCGVPLRSIYALENGESNNIGLDRLAAILATLGAQIMVSAKPAAGGMTESDINSAIEGLTEMRTRFGSMGLGGGAGD